MNSTNPKPATRTLASAAAAALLLGSVLIGCTPQSPAAPPSPSSTTADAAPEDAGIGELLLQDFPDAVRPTVEAVRSVSVAERPQAIVDCMVTAGYEGTAVEADGGISFPTVSADEGEAHALAMYTCEAQYPLDGE